MNQQKGFSLTEVLVSLMLVSTVALALIEQQLQTKCLLNQLVLRAGASHYLDQVDESLFASANNFLVTPNQYQSSLQHMSQSSIFRLHWSKAYKSLTRNYIKMGSQQ